MFGVGMDETEATKGSGTSSPLPPPPPPATRGRGCSRYFGIAIIIVGSVLLLACLVFLTNDCQPAFVASPGDESANYLCELQQLLGWVFLPPGLVLFLAGWRTLLADRRKSGNVRP